MRIAMVFFLAAGLLLANVATSVAADITRSCKSGIDVEIKDVNSVRLGRVAGQGKCGKSVPNKCRERARHVIVKCLEQIWEHRFENRIPPECNTLAGARTGAKLIWELNQPIKQQNRITARIAHWACCTQRPNASRLNVQIRGTISGDKGCAPGPKAAKKGYQSDWAMPSYNVPCDDWRTKKGICN